MLSNRHARSAKSAALALSRSVVRSLSRALSRMVSSLSFFALRRALSRLRMPDNNKSTLVENENENDTKQREKRN